MTRLRPNEPVSQAVALTFLEFLQNSIEVSNEAEAEAHGVALESLLSLFNLEKAESASSWHPELLPQISRLLQNQGGKEEGPTEKQSLGDSEQDVVSQQQGSKDQNREADVATEWQLTSLQQAQLEVLSKVDEGRPYLFKAEVDVLGPQGLKGQQAEVYIGPEEQTLIVDAGKTISDYEELREYRNYILAADMSPSVLRLLHPTEAYFKGNGKYVVAMGWPPRDTWQGLRGSVTGFFSRLLPRWGRKEVDKKQQDVESPKALLKEQQGSECLNTESKEQQEPGWPFTISKEQLQESQGALPTSDKASAQPANAGEAQMAAQKQWTPTQQTLKGFWAWTIRYMEMLIADMLPYMTKDQMEALKPHALKGQQSRVYIGPKKKWLTVDAGTIISDYEELREYKDIVVAAITSAPDGALFVLHSTESYFKGNMVYCVNIMSELPYLTEQEMGGLGPQDFKGQQPQVYIAPEDKILTVKAGTTVADYEELREYQDSICAADTPPPVNHFLEPTGTYFRGNRMYRLYTGAMSDSEQLQRSIARFLIWWRSKWGKKA